jgi:ribosomal protein S24E
MKLTINEKNENVLLERTEVSGDIVFEDKTPSNSEVAQEVAKNMSKDIKLIVVKNIYTTFGHQEATFTAMVYNNPEARDKNEMMTKHLRKKQDELKKQEAAKKEEEKKAAAEKAAEKEVKEEPVTEEKKVEVKEEAKPVSEEKENKAEEKVEEKNESSEKEKKESEQ